MAKKLLAVGLVFLVAVGCWLSFYYSDKEVLRRHVRGIAADMVKKGPESQMEATFKLRGINSLLDNKSRVIIPERGYDTVLEKSSITRYLMYYRNTCKTLAVNLEQVDISIPLKKKAVVQCFVTVRKELEGQDGVSENQGWIELTLEKKEGDWLLQQASLTEALVE